MENKGHYPIDEEIPPRLANNYDRPIRSDWHNDAVYGELFSHNNYVKVDTEFNNQDEDRNVYGIEPMDAI